MRDHFPFLCSLDRPPRRMTVVVVVPDRRRKIDEYLCWNNRCLRPFPFFLLLRRRYKFWRLVQRVYGPKMAKPVEGDGRRTARPKERTQAPNGKPSDSTSDSIAPNCKSLLSTHGCVSSSQEGSSRGISLLVDVSSCSITRVVDFSPTCLRSYLLHRRFDLVEYNARDNLYDERMRTVSANLA